MSASEARLRPASVDELGQSPRGRLPALSFEHPEEGEDGKRFSGLDALDLAAVAGV